MVIKRKRKKENTFFMLVFYTISIEVNIYMTVNIITFTFSPLSFFYVVPEILLISSINSWI